jgi:hypothetical protein
LDDISDTARYAVNLPAKLESLSTPVFLVTPPFTQLNTPYPATAYLKGFLNTKEIVSEQADLGIDLTLALFSRQGLEEFFSVVEPASIESHNSKRI